MFDLLISMAPIPTVIGAVCCVGILAAIVAWWLCEQLDSPARRSQRNLRKLQDAGDGDTQSRETTRKDTSATAAISLRHIITAKTQMVSAIVTSLNVLQQIPVLRILVRPLTNRIEHRRAGQLSESCLFDLPEMVDVLSLALGAGLSFDQAFEWYLDRSDTLLAAEFRCAEQAYRVGMTSRIRAFEEVANTLQEEAVLRFVATLRQTFTLGAPLAPALDTLSYETRRYRASRLEERIAKTPVKLLVPLGACIVPAVLILLMGPIMTQVMSGLSVSP